MNRHFQDAQYHLRRTVQELARGASLTLNGVRSRFADGEDEEEDVVTVVRARGEDAKEKAQSVRQEAAKRVRTIR